MKLKPKKILVVDDEADFVELISERLNVWGYDVIGVTGGKEAIEIVKSRKVDIVVLDYLMPDIDGLETLKEMRKTNKDIPAIIFSGCSDNKLIEGAEELGVVLLPKISPYQNTQATLKAVIQAIEKRLDNHK